MRRLGRVLGTVVTAALVALVISVTVVAPALHLELSTVLTGSMRPVYGPGDLLITAPRDVSTLAVGEIAVFTPPGETTPYGHRITSIQGDPARPALTTKGDANPAPDSWKAMLPGPTVPVVVATIPFAGYPLQWAQNPLLRAMATGLLGLLLTGFGVRLILHQRPQRSSHHGQRANSPPAG